MKRTDRQKDLLYCSVQSHQTLLIARVIILHIAAIQFVIFFKFGVLTGCVTH